MYYDHSVKGLPEIKSHATVRIRMGKTWEPATVTAQHTAPRSYLVSTPDSKNISSTFVADKLAPSSEYGTTPS